MPETGTCFELNFYRQQSNKSRNDTATDDVDDELGTSEGTCSLIIVTIGIVLLSCVETTPFISFLYSNLG